MSESKVPDDQQQVSFVPNTITPMQSEMRVGPSIPLPFKGVILLKKWIVNADSTKLKQSGSVRDLFKDEVCGKGQVYLDDLRIVCKGFKAASEIGFVFHAAEESPSEMDELEAMINAEVFTLNNSTIGNRFVVDLSMPKGVGRRLMPPDPDLPDVHLTILRSENFTGRIVITATVSFSKLVLESEDF
ncbi:MAG: hypothetical protein [Bramyrmic virus 1]|nr:MAG: hypothetical protein [Bramyrmic virus 1]